MPLTDGGLECHLGAPDRVDLALRFEKGSAFCSASASVLTSCIGDPVQHRTAAWLREDSRGDPPLSLWLEYDRHGERLAEPSLFLGPGLGKRIPVPKSAQWSRELDWLTGGGYSRSISSCIDALEQALPSGGFITYIGRMAASRGDLWRVVVAGVTAGSLAAYLCTVSWPGPADVLDAAVESAGCAESSLCLALDILPGEAVRVGPVLGLEFGMPSETARTAVQMQRLLSPVYGGEVLEALRRWPGVTCCGDRHWPEALRAVTGGVVRRVNHIKLVYTSSVHPLYKAYLYFGLVGQEALSAGAD